jgi:hypothetical protein
MLGRPYAVLAWTFGGFVQVGHFLHRSVRAMDRDFVDDIPTAIGELAIAVARVFSRGERRAAADGVPASVAPEADVEPGQSEHDRSRLLLLLAMMALIASVVLSSLILG